MSSPRVVSFLPSATETLYLLGMEKSIVGVTHECDYPRSAAKKPRVISSSFDSNSMSAKEIDDRVLTSMKSGKEIYVIDDKVLKRADPDLIVAQGLCEVCSPFTKEINRALKILDGKPDVLVLDPHDLDDVLVSIMDVAERVGRVRQGRELVAKLQKRIDIVRRISAVCLRSKPRPKVLCIEWLDPLFTAGHWVPQMVEIAGGFNGISLAGEASRRMTINEAAEFDPDIIVLMPCGFDLKRIRKDLLPLQGDSMWKSLRAVRSGAVYAVDAGSYFSKPGPRVVAGLEILAKIILGPGARRIRVPRNSWSRIGPVNGPIY